VKVCHVIDHLGLGGAQSVVADLIEARGNHIQPHVIALRSGSLDKLVRRIEDSGASYNALSLNKLNPAGLWRLRNALKQGSFDLLHTHLEYSNAVGVIAAASLGRHQPRIVRHIHADPMSHNSVAYRTIARATSRFVDTHIAAGPTVAAGTVSMLAKAAGRVKTIRNGIDIKSFEGANIDMVRVRSLRGGARRVIGFVGRLAEAKDPVTLIDAMPDLLAAEPSTLLLIIGDGPQRKKLSDRCRQNDVSHAVKFAGYQENMAEAYRAMDVLAFATRYEGLPVSIIEAMLMRIPIVASAAPGVTDIVQDGSTGLLVTPSNVVSMTAGVLRLFEEPGLAESLKNTAYDVVRSSYSRRRMTDEVENVYAEVLSRTP
jgi:glycosyltransferase involved in cell wall biosynthesis